MNYVVPIVSIIAGYYFSGVIHKKTGITKFFKNKLGIKSPMIYNVISIIFMVFGIYFVYGADFAGRNAINAIPLFIIILIIGIADGVKKSL